MCSRYEFSTRTIQRRFACIHLIYVQHKPACSSILTMQACLGEYRFSTCAIQKFATKGIQKLYVRYKIELLASPVSIWYTYGTNRHSPQIGLAVKFGSAGIHLVHARYDPLLLSTRFVYVQYNTAQSATRLVHVRYKIAVPGPRPGEASWPCPMSLGCLPARAYGTAPLPNLYRTCVFFVLILGFNFSVIRL